MRDDELRTRLRDRNPWWRASSSPADRLAWTQSDVTLRGLRAHEIGYDPPVFDDLAVGDLCVLRGPRRVGKSVAVKRFIARLLENPSIEPSQIIYLAVSDFTARDLRRALVQGRDLTRSVGDETPRYWLFDEITAVKGWLPLIKEARDETPLAHDLVILTGSSANDLIEARSVLGAGRAGSASRRFRLLLPMTFRDYLRTTAAQLPEVPVIAPAELVSPEAKQAIISLDPFVNELDLAWQNYCEIGGYPRAVAEAIQSGGVSDAFCRDLTDWLAPDVTPDDPYDSVVQLVHSLCLRMAAPLNERDTARALAMSRERFRTRLNRLVNTLAATWCHQINDSGQPVEGSQSKLYLIDPLLARLPHMIDPAAYAAPDLTLLSEAALGISLAQAVERAQDGRFVEGRAIGYARTGGGNEVDFAPIPLQLAGSRVFTTPVESKWVSAGWRGEALTLENKYGQGIMATKNILDVDGFPTWAVPASILALLLA